MQVEAGSAHVFEHDLPVTLPGAASQAAPASSIESASRGIDGDGDGRGGVEITKLVRRALADQLGDPVERTVESERLTSGSKQRTHQLYPPPSLRARSEPN